MAKKPTSKQIIIAAIALTAAVIIYAVIAVKFGNKAGDAGGSKRGGKGTTVSVKTEIASVKTLHDYVRTNGDVEAVSSIQVFPDIGGKVVDVHVSLGSSVTKGEVIAKIDPSVPGAKYALSPVYAPISGSILSTPLKNGTTVSTSSAITTIGDVSDLQVTANIPERFVALLKIGLHADVTLEAYQDVVFPATVIRISPVVDSTSRTKEIILAFDREDSRIDAGMFAKITLYTIDYKDSVTISGDAIVTKDEKQYAYVVTADNKAEQREVKPGKSVDGVYQILSGIKAGEKVIIEGTSTLSDGSSIKDITNATAAASSDNSARPADAAKPADSKSWSGKKGQE
jgi:membrane fusion protein, multidrug efflux system